MRETTFDLAIVGGGPAGLATALTARASGVCSIALLERKQRWGVPVQCAEFVPKLLARSAPIPKEAIAGRIETIRLFLDGERLTEIRAPGYVLRRDVWEASMARLASEAGVVCRDASRVLKVQAGRLWVLSEGMPQLVNARCVIGADGPKSVVRRSIGLEPVTCACGVQETWALTDVEENAEIHFSTRCGAGYAWFFPRGSEANVGVGLDLEDKNELRPWLAEIVGNLRAAGRLHGEKPLRRTGGLIPKGGGKHPTVHGRTILVGDAAGQTHPVTGAGIYHAVVCGQMAGEAVAKALEKDDPSKLKDYESAWRDLLGAMLERSVDLQRELSKSRDRSSYERALRKAWAIKRRND